VTSIAEARRLGCWRCQSITRIERSLDVFATRIRSLSNGAKLADR